MIGLFAVPFAAVSTASDLSVRGQNPRHFFDKRNSRGYKGKYAHFSQDTYSAHVALSERTKMSTGKRSKNSRLEKLFGKATRRDAFNRRLRCEFLEDRHLLSATTISLTTGLSTFLENAGNKATYGTVTLSEASTTDTTVNLSALNLTGINTEARLVDSDGNAITNLVIAAGNTTATFFIDAVDDSAYDQSQTIRITASASGCTSGTKDITVTDDESTLTVTLNASSVSEAAGTKAVTGTVKIAEALSTDLTITLSVSGGSSRLSASTTTVTIYAGDTDATFSLNATDNSTYEGTEIATVRATATGWVTGKKTITVTDNDLPGLTVALSPTSVGEDTTSLVTGTIYRQGDTSNALTVTITSSDTSEAWFYDSTTETYTNSITVTIEAGASSADFDIYIVDDTIVDGTQSVTITAKAANYTTDTATLSVTDDDVAKTLSVALSSSSVVETKGKFTGTVTRTGSADAAIEVTITSSDTSEAAFLQDDGTYTNSITVTILAGATSADFDIYAIDDALVDGTQSVTITAKQTDYTSGTATLSVTDDDVAKTLSVALSSSSVVETKGKFTGTVTRTGSADAAIEVTITSSDTSEAAFLQDDGTYANSITVTIEAGATSADFDIYAIDDALVDGTQSVTITAKQTAYTSGTATLSVTDDDVAKTITIDLNPSSISETGGTATGTITLSQAAAFDMIITLVSSDLTEAKLGSSTVEIKAGETSATFTINAVSDTIVDGTQSVTITASDSSNLNYTAGTATLKVTDDDVVKTLTIDIDPSSISENGGTATGTVTVSVAPTSDLVITLTSSDTTEAKLATSTVTIYANTTSSTFTINAVDDSVYDGDESVTITAAASGYTSDTGSITVTDDEEDTPLTLSIADVTAYENAGSKAFTFVVTLSKVYSYAVTVQYATSNGTAKAGSDYKAVSGKVTIAAGQTTAKIVIPVYGDSAAEANETFYVTLSNPTYASLADSKATGTIKNDDKNNTSTIGVYNPTTSVSYLKNSNTSGAANTSFSYSEAESDWVAIAGDWDGDGTDTIGYYDPTTSIFYLLSSNSSDAEVTSFKFGTAKSGWTPLAGDWNGDGVDTIGLYNTAASKFYLRNANSAGAADLTFKFGTANKGWKAIVGDWDGDGDDTIGVYNPTTSTFYLRNYNSAGSSNKTFKFGTAKSGWTPIAGDWNGDGADTIGLYNTKTSKFYLRNANSAGSANLTFKFGSANRGWTPLIGNWTGYGSSLLASGGALTSSTAASLTQAQLNSVIKAAIARLADALNLDAAAVEKLESTQFVITNLTGASLGLADGNTVYIDANAAGYGWFVDSTATTDEEYKTTSTGSSKAISSSAVDKIDLLTVVEHELGHILGLDDLDSSLVNDLMCRTLGTGVRRSATDALDLAIAAY